MQLLHSLTENSSKPVKTHKKILNKIIAVDVQRQHIVIKIQNINVIFNYGSLTAILNVKPKTDKIISKTSISLFY